jgi:hypothetical protein
MTGFGLRNQPDGHRRYIGAAMEPVRPGMGVYAINDKSVGRVARVNACCFEFTSETGRFAVNANAIFHVDGLRVSLICQESEIPHYRCGMHSGRLLSANE